MTSIVGGEARPVQRTTPEAIDLQRTFREMLDGGDVACAMEISSHALELRRAEGIHCAAAVFTNLSQDHLDFHPDMESYFLAKRRLFETDPGCGSPAPTTPYGRRLAAEFPGTLTFGIDAEADIRALDVRSDAAGSDFTLRTADGEWPVRLGAAGPLQRAQRARRVGGRARARRRAGAAARHARRAAARCPGASSPSTRASRSRSSSTTRTSRTRSRTSCVSARAVADGARDRRVRRGRRPRPGQAADHGGDRRRGSPTSRSSPPTTRAPRIRRRSSPRSRRARARAASRRRSTGVPPSPARSSSRGRATSS